MRNLLPATAAALEAGSAIIYSLVKINTPTPIFATDAHRKINHLGEVYRTDTGMGKLPNITQEFSLSAGTIALTFSDIDDAYLAMSQNDGIYNAQLDIHFAVLSTVDDSTLEVIPSVARGYLHQPDPMRKRMKFVFKNHMHKFSKTAGRRTNIASQNRFYPDDKGFENLSNAAGGIQL
jgi:hypothetical protein